MFLDGAELEVEARRRAIQYSRATRSIIEEVMACAVNTDSKGQAVRFFLQPEWTVMA